MEAWDPYICIGCVLATNKLLLTFNVGKTNQVTVIVLTVCIIGVEKPLTFHVSFCPLSACINAKGKRLVFLPPYWLLSFVCLLGCCKVGSLMVTKYHQGKIFLATPIGKEVIGYSDRKVFRRHSDGDTCKCQFNS